DKMTGQATLDSTYPNGSYRVVINTVHDGTRSSVLSLTGDAYPNDPHFSNFAAAQAIDPATNFTLTWDAFVGGTVDDIIQVIIGDAVTGDVIFETPLAAQAGALAGNVTSVTIPSNTLLHGRTYVAQLVFAKITAANNASYPGVPGVTGYFEQTDFSLAT